MGVPAPQPRLPRRCGQGVSPTGDCAFSQMARPVTGGCKVLEDPNRRGDEVALFWRSQLLTDLVCLTLAPANANSQLRFEPRRWPGQQSALATSEGLHLILRLRHNAQYRLLLPGPDPPRYGSPLAIVIEPNRFWRSRVAAAERFLGSPRIRRFRSGPGYGR
jgi:hypothetical protein